MNRKVLAQMAKMMVFVLSVIIAGVFTSCDKNEEVLQTPPVMNQVEGLEVSPTSELRTTTAVPAKYEISENILKYFRHYCQRYAGETTGTYPNAENAMSAEKSQGICCPTSYMMAAACLAQYQGIPYDFGGQKVEKLTTDNAWFIKNDPAYKYLYVMANHANDDDSYFLCAYKAGDAPKNESAQPDRNKVKLFMQNALSNNQFVMVSICAQVGNYNKVNDKRLYSKKLDNPDLTNTPSYFLTTYRKKTGHVILIIGIETNETGDGIVTYIDPIAQTKNSSNRRYVKYSTLLNSMKASSSSKRDYNAIAIGVR